MLHIILTPHEMASVISYPMEQKIRDDYRSITDGLATRLVKCLITHGHQLHFNPLDPSHPPIQAGFRTPREYNQQYLQLMKPHGTRVLFLGMSPSNTGMGVNGIPFGDPTSVINFLGIPVPPNGDEPSGRRLWGLIRDICGTREQFFKNCFVQNVCPILCNDPNGRHKNPFELGIPQIKKLCAEALSQVIQLLQPEIIVAFGNDAESVMTRNQAIMAGFIPTKIEHPSSGNAHFPNGRDQKWKEHAYDVLLRNRIVQIMNPRIPPNTDTYQALMNLRASGFMR